MREIYFFRMNFSAYLFILLVIALIFSQSLLFCQWTELISPNEEFTGIFGVSVSGVPDVNGDGVGDVIVGAPHENPGIITMDDGRAYIFDGATGNVIWTLASPNWELDGNFGISVSGISDVNGDGRGDVVVGAWREDPLPSPVDAGRAYIFDGATGVKLFELASPNDDNDGRFGVSVSGVPDVSGDGKEDVVIGAHWEDPGEVSGNYGRAYIFNGATGVLIHELSSPNAQTDGYFGYSVSGVPDTNGNFRGDVVIGAYNEDVGGKAYIFDGSTGNWLQTLVSPNEETDGKFGYSVSGISDVNGDGRGDVVVGAYLEDPDSSPEDAGRAYIFDGVTGVMLQELISPNEEPYGRFGYSVAGIVDTSGGGAGYVIVGAPYEVPEIPLDRAGRTYVFDGFSGTAVRMIVSPNKEINGNFGCSVSGIPETSITGVSTVVIGAFQEDPGTSPDDAGRAYVGIPQIYVSDNIWMRY